MLDVNLGNKTLVIGVLIALILSYGMVNFDSGSAARQTGPAIQAARQSTDISFDQAPAPDTTAQESSEIESNDTASTMSIYERRHLNRL